MLHATVNLLMTIPQPLIFSFACVKLLNIHRPKLFALTFLPSVVLPHIVFFTLLGERFIFLRMLFMCFLIFALVRVSSGDSLAKILIFIIIQVCILLCSELIALIIFGGIWGRSTTLDLYDLKTLFFIKLQCNLIYAALCYFSCALIRSTFAKATGKQLGIFALFPFTQSIIFIIFTGYAYFDGRHWNELYILSTAFFLLCILGDGYLLHLLERFNARNRMEQENILLEAKLKIRLRHYQYLMAHIQKINKIRHDLNNHIQTAIILLDQGKHAAANQYLDRLRDDVAAVRQPSGPYQVFSTLISSHEQFFQEHGVAFSSSIPSANTLGLSEPDICSLFFNLFELVTKRLEDTITPITSSLSMVSQHTGGDTLLTFSIAWLFFDSHEQWMENSIEYQMIMDIILTYGGAIQVTTQEHVSTIEIRIPQQPSKESVCACLQS